MLLRKCRSIRQAHRVTQARFAKFAGVSRGKIKRLEGGELTELDRDEFDRLAGLLSDMLKRLEPAPATKMECPIAAEKRKKRVAKSKGRLADPKERKKRVAKLKSQLAERKVRKKAAAEARKVLEEAGLLDVTLRELLSK